MQRTGGIQLGTRSHRHSLSIASAVQPLEWRETEHFVSISHSDKTELGAKRDTRTDTERSVVKFFPRARAYELSLSSRPLRGHLFLLAPSLIVARNAKISGGEIFKEDKCVAVISSLSPVASVVVLRTRILGRPIVLEGRSPWPPE